ncbi:MAG: response regulator [Eubacterium sp.]|nr:response regulator [Eubacterium sp.]
MIIFVIDDEERIIKSATRHFTKLEPDARLETFMNPMDALNAIKKDGIIPDIVFCDIEMPEISGIKLAAKLKSLVPDLRIVFVTAYSEYAVDAFKVEAQGYLMKPVSLKDLRKELDRVPTVYRPQPGKLDVRCFGHFEVFFDGKPLVFQRRQSKELLAFLVDRQGKLCTSEDIGAALWEDELDMTVVGQRIRNLISDLRNTFSEIKMEDAIIRDHRQVAINKEMIDCDYYRMLEGDIAAINTFKGEYMVDYSWAEYTAGMLTYNED